ncbi:helix-turn-helix domain-containing protein [Streptomyces sp. NPDC094448]|uniref:helix-turn-helix domain-containing protein n=1 Tax=Streptomyces sp. NPDC094448 TaxID=3366063 RepID=UPI0037F3805E
MSGSGSSSVQAARKVLGDRLGELRRDARLTGQQLARACGWHPSKASRIENARTLPSVDDIRAWCAATGAEDQASDLVESLHAVEGMFIEWRRMERTGLRRAQESVLPLFERTRRFRSYSSWLVPGVIQTRAYTTEVLRAVQRRRVPIDDVDGAVQVRMDRQRILHERGRTFAFLVEESVLRNGMGGPGVMAAQLDRLLEVGNLPQVSLGVVPMRADRPCMPVEGFWIYDAAQVNVELVSGYLTLTRSGEVAVYAARFSELASAAVYGAAARRLISAARNTLG